MSGLEASARTVEASASNVANVRTATRISEARLEPGTATRQSDSTHGSYRPVRVRQDALRHGGVRATLQEIDPPHAAAYEPTNPLANDSGLVALPRVEIEAEFVNLIHAKRAYEANLKAIQAEDQMTGSLLDTIR